MAIFNKMKHFFITLVYLFLSLPLLAQNQYFVRFPDKRGGNYDISKPAEFLSARALERRRVQGIPIDSMDLPVSDAYLQRVLATGCQVNFPLRWFNGAVVAADTVQLQKLKQLRDNQQITWIERVFTAKSKKGKSKRASKSVEAEDVTFDYGDAAAQIEMLNGQYLHQCGFTGGGMVIAVLDAGFKYVDLHPAFDSIRNNGQILGTRDFVNPVSNIYREHEHGAQVLSTIAANVPHKMVGTAPHASFWLIRTEDDRSEQIVEEYAWVAGAELADSAGADVITTSLGYNTFDYDWQDHNYEELDGVTAPISRGANAAASRGMLVVASAGNEGDNVWYYICVPADAPGVLSVGAVDADRQVAWFSSRGPTADQRVKPDVCAMGVRTLVCSGNKGFTRNNGTSFAAPIMAGMATCLWQANRNLKPAQLIELIRRKSSHYTYPNEDVGYGVPNFGPLDNRTEFSHGHHFQTFPNPVDNVLNINMPHHVGTIIKVSIVSMMGKVMYTNVLHVNSLNLHLQVPQNLLPGLYVLQVVAHDRVYTSKFVKN